jgi:U32 family peptidase
MAKVELLAPAGNAETYGAALDGGADAIYVGAPGFNARNLSRDLRLEEIAAMIGNCRRLGKKLFVAANSLVLEDELPQVIELLALLRELRPDGLIVQDLGLLRLARRYFPELPLHASTLMFAHNQQAVRYLAELGCRRVVLARELTVKEIGVIAARRDDTEIEVFIHGAMCFSYSGLCLFSSYLGGKSGLRGRCVQPCRRGFGEVGRGRGDKEGGASRYLFSMNDLSALEILPELLETGITSLKIEGRQRSATYVEKVVGAYRRVLDASPDSRDEAIAAARVMIEQAMSRRLGSGYFLSPQPAEAISPYHSGNLGVHLGRFAAVKKAGGEQVCRFVTKSGLAVGDRLRLHREPSGERVAFRVKSLFAGTGAVRQATTGERVSLALPTGFVLGTDSHVEVYKVDGGDGGATATLPGMAEATAELAAIRRSRARAIREVQESILPRVLPVSTNSSGQGAPGRAEKRQGSLEWWLKTDALKVVLDRTVTPDRYLLPMSTALLGQVAKIKNGLGKNMRSVVWALPPLLTEGEVVRCRRQLTVLLRSGFRLFQLGHLSQSRLFEGEKVGLYADYTCNLSNSQALTMAADLGLAGAQAAIELDKQSLANLLGGVKLAGRPEQIWGVKRGLAVGLTVYGSPALFTSRLAPDHFHYQRSIRSPKNEDFVLKKIDGGSVVHGDKPFSLLPYQQELREAGLDYAVVDIVGTNANARFLEELRERLANSGRYGKLPTFNYLGKLL